MNNSNNSSKDNLSTISSDNNSFDNIEDLINIYLSSSATGVDLGHTFNYTIIIENNSSKTIYDLNITQKISKNLRLSDVMVDSVNISNIDKFNKFITFFVDEIKSNEKKIIDIIVEVVSLDSESHLSSAVQLSCTYFNSNNCESVLNLVSSSLNIPVIIPSLVLKKTSTVLEAIVGDIITFYVYAENRGNVFLNNVIVRDILSSDLRFIDRSIFVDNINSPESNIVSGINIGSLKEGTKKCIKFQAEVIARSNHNTTTLALGQYQYLLKNESKPREGNSKSNENSIVLQSAALDIAKSVNKTEISLGDELTTKITITNTGTLNIKNIILREIIDSHLSFNNYEFFINNLKVNNLDFAQGILIGDLCVGESIIITYQSKYNTSTDKGFVTNESVVSYNYQQSAGLIFKGNDIQRSVNVNTTVSNFKYMNISEKLFKPCESPNIFEVDNVLANVTNLDYHIVKTIIGTSNSGQILTGNKIITQNLINITVEYTSDDGNNSVFTFTAKIPFSTFIILPKYFKVGSKVNITTKVENINFKKKDNCSVYLNLSLLIIAKVHSYDNI